MVQVCCVALCKNNAKTPNISMHNFTKDPKLINVWLHKIRRDTVNERNKKPFKLHKFTKICSAHFVRSDFLIKSEKHRLKPTAIPSRFPWSEPEDRSRYCHELRQEHPVEHPLHHASYEIVTNDSNVVENVIEPGNSTSDSQVVNSITEQSLNTMPDVDEKNCAGIISIVEVKEHMVIDNLEQKYESNEIKRYCDKSTNVVHNITENKLEENLTFEYKNFTSTFSRFSVNLFKDNNSEMMYYTGFPTFEIFKKSLDLLFDCSPNNLIQMNYYSAGNSSYQHLLSREDEYFLILIKLRQNFEYQHLSNLFNISVSTVCNIFSSWINFIYIRLSCLNIWPHRRVLFENYSDEFKANYSNVIGSLDAIEIYTQTPTSLQSQTCSNHKHSNTVKGLVAIDGNGIVIFVSPLFTGSMSDDMLLKESGFITTISNKIDEGYLLPGDTFLADKGFTSGELLNPVNISIPVFKVSNCQFTVDEVHHTHKIAHARAHIERAIERIKNYKILGSEVPHSLLGTFNQVWTICCLLSSLHMPLRSNIKEESNDRENIFSVAD